MNIFKNEATKKQKTIKLLLITFLIFSFLVVIVLIMGEKVGTVKTETKTNSLKKMGILGNNKIVDTRSREEIQEEIDGVVKRRAIAIENENYVDSISRDLGYKKEDILNLSSQSHLSDEAIEKLLHNGFVVSTFGNRGFFNGYSDDSARKDRPNFVTVDSVIHIFNLLYDNVLIETEEDFLYPKLVELTNEMYKKALETRKALKGTD
jgi:hypothetical protein